MQAVTQESLRGLAKGMFDAYNAEGPNPWKTFDGRDVPRWEALTDQVRGKWEAAARFAVDFVPDEHRGRSWISRKFLRSRY